MEQSIDYKGYKIKIIQDDGCDSPDEWGNDEEFLVYEHRQFSIRRDGFEPRAIFDYLNYPKHPGREDFDNDEDYESAVDDWDYCYHREYGDYYIFTVNAYIHSGVSLSLGREYPFNDRWDVSTTGFILVKKSCVPNEEKAKDYAENLIETWNQYLSGDVWGFVASKEIECDKCGHIEDEEFDSCWGFYGEEACIDEAKATIDNYIKHEGDI